LDWCGSSNRSIKIGPETAYGDVAIRNNGVLQSLSVEIKQSVDGAVKAVFYSPLGVTLATVTADSLRGTVAYEDREFAFTLSQTMDSLPFAWGKGLTYGDFLRALLGRPPITATDIPCEKAPDSLVAKRNAIFAMWKTDTLVLREEINRGSGQLCAVKVTFNNRPSFRNLIMGSFNHGIAHNIRLFENDGNYFSIHYARITFK
jgi:hypothetical protein